MIGSRPTGKASGGGFEDVVVPALGGTNKSLFSLMTGGVLSTDGANAAGASSGSLYSLTVSADSPISPVLPGPLAAGDAPMTRFQRGLGGSRTRPKLRQIAGFSTATGKCPRRSTGGTAATLSPMRKLTEPVARNP